MHTTIKINGLSQHSAQKQKILNSRLFKAAPKLATLLDALVNYTVNGRQVSQRTIHEDHFRRGAPASVGTYVDRLRKKLKDYYETEGARDDLILEVGLRDYTVCVRESTTSFDVASAQLWKDRRIAMTDFRRFLTEQCDAEGTTEKARNDGVRKWFGALVDAQLRFGKLKLRPRSAFEDFFDHFESGSAKDERALNYEEMATLAGNLGIHPIVLDPLRSSAYEGDGVVLRLATPSPTDPHEASDAASSVAPRRESKGTARARCQRGDFWIVGSRGDDAYGRNATYSIPNIRLSGTDAAFVRLHLDGGGSSTDHHHAGDEMALVLDGAVEITMADSGLTMALGQGSYTHFYAEQTHGVRNASDSMPAELLIIRFYQSGKPYTRQDLRRQLWKFANREGQLSPLALGWLIAAAADRSVRKTPSTDAKGIPDQVLNRLGLAQLLNRVAPLDGPARTKFLGRRVGDKRTLGDCLAILERNLARVPKDVLVDLAELPEIFRFLAYEFLFPSVPRQIVVTRDGRDAEDSQDRRDWVDMADIVASMSIEPTGGPVVGVTYEVPVRSLACSDILVT